MRGTHFAPRDPWPLERSVQTFDLHRYHERAPLASSALYQSFCAKREGRDVVIKQLLPELAAMPETREAWLQQARLAAGAPHPGIATVIDWGVAGQDAYLAMEALPGCDLRRALDVCPEVRRRFPIEDAVVIARTVLEALDWLHTRVPSRLHLDLSPQNIRVKRDGQVVITEPGLWAALSPSETIRRRFDHGCVGYLSPEQVRAEPALDVRSDLFSLGVILLDLLAGKPIFAGDSAVVVAMAITRGDRPAVNELRNDLPADLAGILESLCRHDPAERFTSARAALTALQTMSCAPVELANLARRVAPRDPAPSPAHRTSTARIVKGTPRASVHQDAPQPGSPPTRVGFSTPHTGRQAAPTRVAPASPLVRVPAVQSAEAAPARVPSAFRTPSARAASAPLARVSPSAATEMAPARARSADALRTPPPKIARAPDAGPTPARPAHVAQAPRTPATSALPPPPPPERDAMTTDAWDLRRLRPRGPWQEPRSSLFRVKARRSGDESNDDNAPELLRIALPPWARLAFIAITTFGVVLAASVLVQTFWSEG